MTIPSKAAMGSIFRTQWIAAPYGQRARCLQITSSCSAEQPSPPSCRYCPNPEYPPEAREAKIPNATVPLEIVVLESGDADGHDIRVLKEDRAGKASVIKRSPQ